MVFVIFDVNRTLGIIYCIGIIYKSILEKLVFIVNEI
jgi:hypothetical protein